MRLKIAMTALLCASLVLAAGSAGESRQTTPFELSPTAWRYMPGDYQVSWDRIIGIDAFLGDSGERMLLFSDYATGTVRRLFPSSSVDYEAGPGFGKRYPTAFYVHIVDGHPNEPPSALRVTTPDGKEVVATRLPIEERAVHFRSGSVTLAGTLLWPKTSNPADGVVLLHGSGPLTRYSFGPYPHFFASLGLAVLVYDKRGTGQSTGDDMSMDDYYPQPYTGDAVAAVRFLQSQSGMRKGGVGVWGSSEGGMLTTQLCARVPRLAFAINSSGFMLPLWQQMLYNTGAELRAERFSEADSTEATALRQLQFTVGQTGHGWADLKKRTMLDRNKGWFGMLFAAETPSVSVLTWRWQHVYRFNPLTSLAAAHCPILGLFGALDTSTPARISAANMREALNRGGNKRVEVKIFAHADHSLDQVTSSASSALETSPGMATGVFSTIKAFISKWTQ